MKLHSNFDFRDSDLFVPPSTEPRARPGDLDIGIQNFRGAKSLGAKHKIENPQPEPISKLKKAKFKRHETAGIDNNLYFQ